MCDVGYPDRCANLKRVCGRRCRGVPGRRRHALGPETRADCRVDARQGASGNGGNGVLQGIAFRDIRGYRRSETLGGGAFRIGGRHRNRGFPFHKRCHGDLAARHRDAHGITGHGDAIDQRGARKAARRIDQGRFTTGNQGHVRQRAGCRRRHVLHRNHEALPGAACAVRGGDGDGCRARGYRGDRRGGISE